jgi:hypothetical protein
VRRRDVGHSASKPQPAVQDEHPRTAHVQGSEIKNHPIAFGESAQLRRAQARRR